MAESDFDGLKDEINETVFLSEIDGKWSFVFASVESNGVFSFSKIGSLPPRPLHRCRLAIVAYIEPSRAAKLMCIPAVIAI